jgi:hypothetical protein
VPKEVAALVQWLAAHDRSALTTEGLFSHSASEVLGLPPLIEGMQGMGCCHSF